MNITEEEKTKLKEIPRLMSDEEWWSPYSISKEIGVDESKVETMLHWLVGKTEQYFKRYRSLGGDEYGGGSVSVYFKREPPEQRTLGDFA